MSAPAGNPIGRRFVTCDSDVIESEGVAVAPELLRLVMLRGELSRRPGLVGGFDSHGDAHVGRG